MSKLSRIVLDASSFFFSTFLTGQGCASELPPIAVDRTPGTLTNDAGMVTFVLPPIPKELVDPSLESDGQRYRIKKVTFRGNTVFTTRELEALTKPYLNRSIGALEIEELRQQLTRQYVDKGYVSSGALLTNPIRADASEVDFTIAEGRVGLVRVEGLERLSERYVADRLIPDANSVLNIDQLRERYELLLSDPLFNSLSIRLAPGIAQGSSVLYVNVSRALPYQFSIFYNNYSAPSVGESALGMSGLVRNLTGYGDTLNFNAQGPRDNFTVNRKTINWIFPINAKGTKINLQADHGASSVIEGSVASLDIKSELSSVELGVNQTFLNTPSLSLSYTLSRSERRNDTSLLGVPYSFSAGIPDGVLRETAWKLSQDFSWRNESSVLAARVTLNQIENNLVPDLVGNPDLQPPNQYLYWVTQLTAGRRLAESGIQLQIRVTFQNASTHLTSLDRFGIGGAMTVRGYRENQLLRDTGAVVSLEADIPVYSDKGPEKFQLGVVPFFSWGQVKNIDEPNETLSSVGIAFRSEWQNLIGNLAIAKRLIRPSSVDALSGTLQDMGIHLQLTYNF